MHMDTNLAFVDDDMECGGRGSHKQSIEERVKRRLGCNNKSHILPRHSDTGSRILGLLALGSGTMAQGTTAPGSLRGGSAGHYGAGSRHSGSSGGSGALRLLALYGAQLRALWRRLSATLVLGAELYDSGTGAGHWYRLSAPGSMEIEAEAKKGRTKLLRLALCRGRFRRLNSPISVSAYKGSLDLVI
jgi:hypothetical protein